jgi:hypothetical protein
VDIQDESSVLTGVGRKKTIFFSHRFADDYAEGMIRLLEQSGYTVVTGKSANTYISKAILNRIKSCDFFLCLMTRDKPKTDGTYTTSPWLLEEKGAALAFGKTLILMVEEGVSDFGGLQGDWQRIHFVAKGFLRAALEAIEQLRSYDRAPVSGRTANLGLGSNASTQQRPTGN